MSERIPFDPKVILDTIIQLHSEGQETDVYDIYRTARNTIQRTGFIRFESESIENRG